LNHQGTIKYHTVASAKGIIKHHTFASSKGIVKHHTFASSTGIIKHHTFTSSKGIIKPRTFAHHQRHHNTAFPMSHQRSCLLVRIVRSVELRRERRNVQRNSLTMAAEPLSVMTSRAVPILV
jgi:hypothetical protein